MTLPRHAKSWSQPSLVREVRRGSRLLALVACVPLLCTMLSTAYVLQVLQPRVERSTEVTRQLRLAHEGLVDQETGLRAWLATGDRRYLDPFVAGTRTTASAHQQLRSQVPIEAPLGRLVVDVLVESSSWQREWAAAAAQSSVAGLGSARLSPVLEDGRRRFDDYRAAYGAAVARAVLERDAAVSAQRSALTVLLVGDALLAAVAVLVVGPRRRRLTRLVEAPLSRLHAAILRVGDGGAVEVPRLGVTELDEVSDALRGLAQEVRDERQTARRRTEDALDLACKLELVLRTSRVMSSCVDVDEVGAAVVAAAGELTGRPAVLWRSTEQGRWYEAVTERATGEPLPDVVAVVALAGGDGREVHGADGTAWPLVAAGEVLGVLHVSRSGGGVQEPDRVALEALALAGATSLRSAHLAQALQQRASTDALTGLRNRYELDRDLAAEWSHSVRHARPLSFCLLDLDHFKRLNDTEGHQAGDAWLRLVSQTVLRQARTEDTVYRYGGEEIAVLLRDTGEQEAAAFAERCRLAVEALRGPAGGPVTASIGVAGHASGMAGPEELVAAADQALYAAKAGGRNLVVPAAAARPWSSATCSATTSSATTSPVATSSVTTSPVTISLP